MYPYPHTCIASSMIKIPTRGVQLMNLHLHSTITHPKAIVYTAVHSWCCISYEFGQVLMTCEMKCTMLSIIMVSYIDYHIYDISISYINILYHNISYIIYHIDIWYQYHILISYIDFHCPKNPLCSTYSSFLPFLQSMITDWSFYCFHSFAFFRMSYIWNHSV